MDSPASYSTAWGDSPLFVKLKIRDYHERKGEPWLRLNEKTGED
jgi:hypothetical protein